MAGFVSRGGLATALYQLLGFDPTSVNRFADAGGHGAAASTLADLGIFKGVDDQTFAPSELTTRGDLFTALVRLLGLGTERTSAQQAAMILEQEGLIAGEPGVGEPVSVDILDKLLKEVGPRLDVVGDSGQSRNDYYALAAAAERDAVAAVDDPAFQAYLRSAGVERSQIRDEIALRTGLEREQARMRTEQYAEAVGQSERGVNRDYEARGLYRSGGRLAALQRTGEQHQRALDAANLQARQNFELWRRGREQRLGGIETEMAGQKLQAQARKEQKAADERHQS